MTSTISTIENENENKHMRFAIRQWTLLAHAKTHTAWLSLWEHTHKSVIDDILIRIATGVRPFRTQTTSFLSYTQRFAQLYPAHPALSINHDANTPFDRALQIISNVHRYIAKSLVIAILNNTDKRLTLDKLRTSLVENDTIDDIRERISKCIRCVVQPYCTKE